MSNQVQNQPTAAYWLSIIGSIIGILASLGFIRIRCTRIIAAIGAFEDSTTAMDTTTTVLAQSAGAFAFYFAIGAWCLISSILVFIFASKLKANPLEHGKWGLLILIFSIIGLGSILGFIGGILAIVYKPIPAGAPQQYAPQQPYYGPPPQPAAYQHQLQPHAHSAAPKCNQAYASAPTAADN